MNWNNRSMWWKSHRRAIPPSVLSSYYAHPDHLAPQKFTSIYKKERWILVAFVTASFDVNSPVEIPNLLYRNQKIRCQIVDFFPMKTHSCDYFNLWILVFEKEPSTNTFLLTNFNLWILVFKKEPSTNTSLLTNFLLFSF